VFEKASAAIGFIYHQLSPNPTGYNNAIFHYNHNNIAPSVPFAFMIIAYNARARTQYKHKEALLNSVLSYR
jgi:hypothetical protein